MSHSAYSSDCAPCASNTNGAFSYWLGIIVVLAIAIWLALALFKAIDNTIEKNTEDDEENNRNINNRWWHALIAAIIALIVIWCVSSWLGCGGCGGKSGSMFGY